MRKMAFSPSPRVFQELEQERQERDYYKRKCEEYEISLSKLRKRESALVYRLNLAENIQTTAGARLGSALEEDSIRESEALEELQEKIMEMEAIEFRKATALRELALELRAQTGAIKLDLADGIASIESDVKHAVETILRMHDNNIRSQLKGLQESLVADINAEQQYVENSVPEWLMRLSRAQAPLIQVVLKNCCELFQMQMDYDLFWESIRLDASEEDHVKGKNRFLATMSIPRIAQLEKAVELAQQGEARAKRLAVRQAEKHEREIELERAASKDIAQKLGEALDALEKAKADFDEVTLVVNELTRKNKEKQGDT